MRHAVTRRNEGNLVGLEVQLDVNLHERTAWKQGLRMHIKVAIANEHQRVLRQHEERSRDRHQHAFPAVMYWCERSRSGDNHEGDPMGKTA